MKPQITQQLLFDYFSGRVSPIQKQLVDEWAKDADHRELFYQSLHAWESQHPQYIVDLDKAMAGHTARMVSKAVKRPDWMRPARPLDGWIRKRGAIKVAASILVAALLCWQFRKPILNRTYTTHYGEVRQINLPDGSTVTLNANSAITVPRFGFGDSERAIGLEGEALFSVKHTQNHSRFVVRTGQNFDIEVLGTEFSVYNRGKSGRVVLNRGKVQLRYDQGPAPKTITMRPGEVVRLNGQGNAHLQKVRNPESLSAWRDNRFVFENTSLTEIAQLFADTYGLTLVISDPELAKWTITGSFTAHNADELLETLMEVSSLSYTRSGNQIQINSHIQSF
ncbi:anti-sigma factor [Dyadobacter beijingensis]|uniref:Anti-sigma factor n=1 Tax=Dyadobacter beijingensis TaxID=365489 RepID=A0ABQ2HSE9_9BACT|nr:FecR domain-containing protein [Dyadobacter beijingensis]GGM90304.1 anti-sigma factor [Dyadobacter beijingensis]